MRFVTEKVQDDHPALLIAKHVTSKLSPRCRDAFIECLIVNTLLRGVDKRKQLVANTGNSAPTTILMSPTMRCNLTCEGCYAAEYSPEQDLDRSLMQKIVDEGNDMGVYLFTLLGGEPFMWDELLDFARENKDAYFQVFTNGTLLDHDTIDELAKVGNIAPMLSLEGSPELTDERRGDGVHEQIMEIMDHLGEAGVLFGYSCTVTRHTWKAIVSDEFVDPLIAKGALLAWHFLYMPVGRDPDTSMMLTAEERNQFRVDIHRIRDTKPLFPVDFWGDAPWVNGCIAGKHYMHINSGGWVEPCIFTHFATDNIRDVSLLEAFNSDFFKEIRRRQPFNHNLLMPCMWIDNPTQAREIMAATGARADAPRRRRHDHRPAGRAGRVRPAGRPALQPHLELSEHGEGRRGRPARQDGRDRRCRAAGRGAGELRLAGVHEQRGRRGHRPRRPFSSSRVTGGSACPLPGRGGDAAGPSV